MKNVNNIERVLESVKFENLSKNKAGVIFDTIPFDEIETVSPSAWESHVSTAHPKLTIRGWYLLTTKFKDGLVNKYILGFTDQGTWITSQVVAIAPDKRSVVTASGSLYPLTKSGTGVPNVNLAMMIVYAFRAWGLGSVFRGYPEVMM